MTRQRWGFGLLALWIPSMILLVAVLMVDHVAPLPPLGDLPTLRRGLERRLATSRVVHVIAAGCSCTDGLLDHLVARGARADLDEAVLFVGELPPSGRGLSDRGFRLQPVEREVLRRELAIDGAPVLVVRGADGRIAYAGGYFDSPAAVRARDERILADVAGGGSPRSLPLFGCAVSDDLAEERDPTGLGRVLDALAAFGDGA